MCSQEDGNCRTRPDKACDGAHCLAWVSDADHGEWEWRPASATGTDPKPRAHAPRCVPVTACIPCDPAARDHRWTGSWPLRTQLELPALDTAPGCARAHVCAILQEWKADADFTDVAALIVSELLTNAVVSAQSHGCPDPVGMWMLGDGKSVLYLIWDATMSAPVLASATPSDEHGRGLSLVDELCARWGYCYPAEYPGGKVVWALVRAA
jgi:anti-sigma regulatory factor (Ser/Thr protein kinase)